MYQITVDKNRPDFRVFIDLLYGEAHNVDTDGDSDQANSRTWTYLYISDRESHDPPVDIMVKQTNPNIFEVKSESPEFETLAALYLFLYCGTSIAFDDRELEQNEIEILKQRYTAQIQRAEKAIWHESSD